MRKYSIKHILSKETGQVAVEYILLLLVVVSMITAMAKKFNEYFLTDDGSCDDPESTALVCVIKRAWTPDYRIFVLRGHNN